MEKKDWNFKIPKTPPKGYLHNRYELTIPEDIKWEYRDLPELEVYYIIKTGHSQEVKGWNAETVIRGGWGEDDEWFVGNGKTKTDALNDLRQKVKDSKNPKKWKVLVQYTIDGQGTSKEVTITAGTEAQATSKVWDARYDFDNFGIVSVTEIKMDGGNTQQFNYSIGGL
ncbi:MAG: hypothetical protein WCJ62_11650 [Flavobacterium sp.]